MPALDDPRLPSLRDPPVRLATQPFIVEKDGEMPQGSRLLQPISRHQTPIPLENRATEPPATSSFPPYVTADDLRTGTPEPIKVIRSKKKNMAGKKKRTIKSGEGSGTVTPN